jgi:spore coat protein A, manganese oxidase
VNCLSKTLIALVLLAGAAARADVVTLISVKDNTLIQDPVLAQSAGGDDAFFVGRTAQGDGYDIRRGLIAFNLSSIPAGSTINSATLTLYMNKTRSGPQWVHLHRALANWGEGTSVGPGGGGTGGSATTGSATWFHRFYPGEFWTTSGGEFSPTSSGMTEVGEEGLYYSWTGAGLVADVQAWLNTPSGNFGWVLLGNESTLQTAKRFASREASSSRRPRLVVDFTPAATTGACCLHGTHCEVLTPAQCSAQSGTFMGLGTTCTVNPCAPTGACCLPGNVCDVVTQEVCTLSGGVYHGNGTACSPNPCTGAMGACCFSGGVCEIITATECQIGGGMYQGNGSVCAPNPCSVTLEPFVDPLPIPAVAQPVSGTPGGEATYHIAMRQFQQQLHRDLPPTTVWGYGDTYPGPTIEARTGHPVTVKWINDLRDGMGMLRTNHYLNVDLCMHGPHMFGSTPRTVVHLHGGHVPAASDGHPEQTILPGEDTTYLYPNTQQASTSWYHDHAMGITRLNVYMGLAGLYIIRDEVEDALGLPSGEYEIPLVIQDRTFRASGELFYPELWEEHFFGDTVLVNGKVWPYLNVKKGKYRFRLLNGSNARTYTLMLSNHAPLHVIGSDGGLLEAPVEMMQLTMTSGERVEVVMDFSSYAPGTQITLTNSAPAPFPGPAGVGVIPDIMRFIVVDEPGHTAPLPQMLRPVARIPEAAAAEMRDFVIRKHPEPCAGSTWLINGLRWDDITEYPRLNTAEIWSFVNRSGMIHPMHMHLVHFQVLDRQAFEMSGEQIVPIGPRMPPPAHEQGWKDTVAAYPMEITRVIARFENYLGSFAYHCHILEHEDHEMMRQFVTTCYANCDSSTVEPVLNIDDFTCFVNQFALGNPYANCDGSTVEPILNVDDFMCFINQFALGCQ